MAITLEASPALAGGGAIDLTLLSVEGNLQVVMFGHRTSSLVPSITGAGWSAPFLIETNITNGSQRRALVMFWRVVPAGASTTVTTSWSAGAASVAIGYEFSSDTAGGTWSFDETTGRNFNDNGASATTTLASNAVTPEFAEAVAIDGLTTRSGGQAADDSYSDAFIAGAGANEGPGATNTATFSGYKIVDVTPAAMSTTATYPVSALATSIIGVWSIATGGGGITVAIGRVTESGTVRGLTASKALAVGRITETGEARALGTAKARILGRITGTGEARAFGSAKTRQLGRVTETGTARPFAGITELGRVVESGAPRTLSAVKAKQVGRITGPGVIRSFTLEGDTTIGRIVGTGLVRQLTAGKTVQLGRVTEAGDARTLVRVVTFGRVVESGTVRTLAAAKVKPLGRVTEAGVVRGLLANQITVIVAAQGHYLPTVTAAGKLAGTATAVGLHDLIAETEGAL